jgi:predicted Kef-type K+ transport protein
LFSASWYVRSVCHRWWAFSPLGETLETIADLGVTLLLFSIGLKLDLKSLAKPEVWAGASLHMAATVAVFSVAVFGLGLAGLPFFAGLTFPLAILVAFALSFSSTVCGSPSAS